MNMNELEITRLPKPIQGIFLFKPRMVIHPELGCLRNFQQGGKIPVKIFGFSNIPAGKLLHFSPIKMPSIKKCALSKFFESDGLKKLLSL